MSKIVFIISIVVLNSGLLFSQDKEVIKIDVDKECKSCIDKRTYVNEIYTRPKMIMRGWDMYASITFAYADSPIYEDKGVILFVNMNADFLVEYDSKNIFLTINDNIYDLDKLIAFEKREVVLSNKTLVSYSLGYTMSSEFILDLLDAKTLSVAMINNKSRKRKVWGFSPSFIEDLKKTYECFIKYYKPIDIKLIEQKEIERSKYLASLKEYEFNFRKSKWGESKSEVKTNENIDVVAENEFGFSSPINLNGDNYTAHFYFNKNRFYQGVYVLKEDYINENNFYLKYKELKEILVSKYGEPYRVAKNKTNDTYDGLNEIGRAIETGEYNEYSIWETVHSKITLFITGENFDSELTLRYKTKDEELKSDVDKEIKKARTEGF